MCTLCAGIRARDKVCVCVRVCVGQLGALCGAPLGGIMADALGVASPFYALAGLACIPLLYMGSPLGSCLS